MISVNGDPLANITVMSQVGFVIMDGKIAYQKPDSVLLVNCHIQGASKTVAPGIPFMPVVRSKKTG